MNRKAQRLPLFSLLAIAFSFFTLTALLVSCTGIAGKESISTVSTTMPVSDKPTTGSITTSAVITDITTGSEATAATVTKPVVTKPEVTSPIPAVLVPLYNNSPATSESHLLYNLTTSELLYSTELDKKLLPAGTTRLLTALLFCKYTESGDIITVGDELGLVISDASVTGLKKGQKLTRDQMLKALLISAGSDCAYVIAAHTGRIIADNASLPERDAVDTFITEMNSFAVSIGMKSSHFTSPDGYPDEKHYSTLRDMLCLAAAAESNAETSAVCAVLFSEETLVSGEHITFTSRNDVLNPSSIYFYSYARGMSTGYSSASGYCLVSCAKHGTDTLISLVFGASGNDERYTDTAELFNAGFGFENDNEKNTTWIVDCNESISLRKTPDFSGKTLIGIKKGEPVTLIKFIDRFAYIQYDKKDAAGNITKTYRGYVLAAYIVLPEEYSYSDDLSVVNPVYSYTYTQMKADLAKLAELYPGKLSVSSIGESEEGRELVLATLGNPNAKNRIFVQAAMHAREYMTTTFVMAQIDYMLSHQDTLYGDTSYTIGQLLEATCFCIVPMANPDGVNIVQTASIPAMFKGQYSSDEAYNWKANAKGVDINANFNADWESYGSDITEPGSYGYKGTAPESSAEAKALADYIRSESFDITLSYHTTGSVIYYSFGNHTTLNRLNLSLANEMSAVSGFTPTVQNDESTAGLKDWAIDSLGIVSLTVEIGTFNNPLMLREFSNIWARGRDFLLISAVWQIKSGR